MYHNIFEDVEDLFDSRRFPSDMALMGVITESTEEIIENSYITEMTFKTMKLKVKEFFATLRVAMTQFAKDIKDGITDKIKTLQIHEQIKKFKAELQSNKDAGAKSAEMIDVVKLANVYITANNKLWKYVDRYANMEYKKAWQVEADIEAFDKIIEKATAEVEEVASQKVKMNINAVIKFFDTEMTGNGSVIKTLTDSISEFHTLENRCETISKKYDIMGKDIVPKHYGFIRRGINRILAFMKRWVVKIISTTVFFFA